MGIPAKDSTQTSLEKAQSSLVHVQLLKPSARDGGVRVEYAYVRSYIADLYASHIGRIGARQAKDLEDLDQPQSSKSPPPGKVDLFLHIGMADGWDFVSIERKAYKQGFSSDWCGTLAKTAGYYYLPDNAGQTILNTGPCPWLTTPMGLSTSFDVDALVRDANTSLKTWSIPRHHSARPESEIPIKAHDEPGSYCCGFMYYESLANCFVREMTPDVLFCHVPSYLDAASLERGRDCIIAVIEQAVTQLVQRRRNATDHE